VNGTIEDPAAAAVRREKLAALRQAGPAYPNDFSRSHVVRQLVEQHGAAGAEALEKLQATATIAGRLARRQDANGETLAVLEDASGALQICVSDAATGASNHAAFRNWDLGDIVGAMGILYRTHAGELTLRCHELRLLVKSLRPVPDQGELRRLIPLRSRVLAGIRELMRNTQYMEVETPLLQLAADPAAAEPPLETYHNALELKLYLRSASSAHLQRLVIGGIEKVYEINRSFRDAGAEVAAESTLLEVCCGYTNHQYMMGLLQRVIGYATGYALGATVVSCAGRPVDLAAPFARIPFSQAAGKKPLEPTFIVDSPAQAAPRARRRGDDPALAEHFTLIAGGEVIGEGFSLCNDPEVQAGYDADFVRALEYGMPPASGARLDIERLVRLLTGADTPRPC